MHTTSHLRRSTAMAAVGSLAIVAGLATDARAAHPTVPAKVAAHPTARATTSGERYVAAHPSRYVRSAVDMVNRERTAKGLRPYRYDVTLSAVALRWARTMRARQSLQHNPRLASQVTDWRWLGENVGYGPSVKTTHVAFMKSPHHRANVLDRDYTQLGMAVVKDRHNRYWMVEVFRQPSHG